jgi:hypothetical protein
MVRSRALLVPFLTVLVLGTTSCELVNRSLEDFFACGNYGDPDVTDFSTSDAVFRGTWSGTVEDWPVIGATTDLTLDADATIEDADGYTITGTFQLGADPDLALTGSVDGGCAETYVASAAGTLEPATSPPPGARLNAEAGDVDAPVWKLRAEWWAYAPDDQDRATIVLSVEHVDANGDVTFWTDLDLTRTVYP